jgi:hypothetical protein
VSRRADQGPTGRQATAPRSSSSTLRG